MLLTCSFSLLFLLPLLSTLQLFWHTRPFDKCPVRLQRRETWHFTHFFSLYPAKMSESISRGSFHYFLKWFLFLLLKRWKNNLNLLLRDSTCWFAYLEMYEMCGLGLVLGVGIVGFFLSFEKLQLAGVKLGLNTVLHKKSPFFAQVSKSDTKIQSSMKFTQDTDVQIQQNELLISSEFTVRRVAVCWWRMRAPIQNEMQRNVC